MHLLVGILGAILIWLMLAEFFVALILPRRVKRDVRLARGIFRFLWRPWRAVARHLPSAIADTWLGIFGPIGILINLAIWGVGLIIGYAALQWAIGSHLHGAHADFGTDLFFSATAFLSASSNLAPTDAGAKFLQIAEAASGFAVLFIVIGYLPALYQAFSRREVAVSQLTPIAGSPPSAGALLRHSVERSRWNELDKFLEEWETWTAELMETHLSYPILAFFRSQHVNQSWLAALTVIMDTSALRIAAAGSDGAVSAELTFAIGRHALSDLAYVSQAKPSDSGPERLSDEDFQKLARIVERCGAEKEIETMRNRLDELRASYEPQAQVLSERLELPLPRWLPEAA